MACKELKISYEIFDIDDNLLLDLDKLEKYLNQNNNIEPVIGCESKFEYIVAVVHLYRNSIDMD